MEIVLHARHDSTQEATDRLLSIIKLFHDHDHIDGFCETKP